MFRSKSHPITPVASRPTSANRANSEEARPTDEDAVSTGTQTRVNSKHVHGLLYTRKQYKKLKTELTDALATVHTQQYELKVLRALTSRKDANRLFLEKRNRVAGILDDIQKRSQKTKSKAKGKGKRHQRQNGDDLDMGESVNDLVLEDLGRELQALREENERLTMALNFHDSQARLASYSQQFAYANSAIEDLLLGFAYVIGIHACERQQAIEFSKHMLKKFVEENSWEGDDIIIWKGCRYTREGAT
ncbi:uncharacterized protein [Ptychodera flava]|uniref:uncharacterized protein n=1 Tax=Ptychodera flava TaxID=63121 RepID=UPI00396A5890